MTLPCTATTTTDHPRSRGVYTVSTPSCNLRTGSSPLARGLRWSDLPLDEVRGIIPARAGFTRFSHRELQHPGDHPRSRGVYLSNAISIMNPYGSSPLARGLLHFISLISFTSGFIPARAGFTSVFYFDTEFQRGSSPLARGLPACPHDHIDDGGIIPARAGFTGELMCDVCEKWDHPRSRGVYTQMAQYNANQQGSSPLARGLRRKNTSPACISGIIPARAGFTPGPASPRSHRWDHPRSRGVYRDPVPRSDSPQGSSPLARGLLRSIMGDTVSIWIIPARAGFTPVR